MSIFHTLLLPRQSHIFLSQTKQPSLYLRNFASKPKMTSKIFPITLPCNALINYNITHYPYYPNKSSLDLTQDLSNHTWKCVSPFNCRTSFILSNPDFFYDFLERPFEGEISRNFDQITMRGATAFAMLAICPKLSHSLFHFLENRNWPSKQAELTSAFTAGGVCAGITHSLSQVIHTIKHPSSSPISCSLKHLPWRSTLRSTLIAGSISVLLERFGPEKSSAK